MCCSLKYSDSHPVPEKKGLSAALPPLYPRYCIQDINILLFKIPVYSSFYSRIMNNISNVSVLITPILSSFSDRFIFECLIHFHNQRKLQLAFSQDCSDSSPCNIPSVLLLKFCTDTAVCDYSFLLELSLFKRHCR